MSKVKDYLEKSGDEIKDEVKEVLSLLYQMSDAKAKVFEEEIKNELRTAGENEDKTVPITDIIAYYEEIRVVNSKSVTIINEVKESIKNILSSTSKDSNNLVDGIGGIVDGTINTLLGASYGCENTARQYYIATDGLALVRLDVKFWCRAVTVKAIKTYAEKSLVCAIAKSTIDVNKINFNSFLAIYQEQLGRLKFNREQLVEELNKAREIYKKMRDDSSSDVAVEMNGKVDSSYIIGELESSTKKVTGDWPPVLSKLKQ